MIYYNHGAWRTGRCLYLLLLHLHWPALPSCWWLGRAGWGSLLWIYLSSFQATQTCRPFHEFDLAMSFMNTLFCFPLSFSFDFLSFAGHFLTLNFQNSIGSILKLSKSFKGYCSSGNCNSNLTACTARAQTAVGTKKKNILLLWPRHTVQGRNRTTRHHSTHTNTSLTLSSLSTFCFTGGNTHTGRTQRTTKALQALWKDPTSLPRSFFAELLWHIRARFFAWWLQVFLRGKKHQL